jgi:hypothetical protein
MPSVLRSEHCHVCVCLLGRHLTGAVETAAWPVTEDADKWRPLRWGRGAGRPSHGPRAMKVRLLTTRLQPYNTYCI